MRYCGAMLRRALTFAAALLVWPAAAGAAPLITVKVDTGSRGARLPKSFLGISQEYDQIERFTGNAALGYNSAVGALIHRLGSFGDGPPVLRVGGVSTDSVWWNPDGRPKPPGVYITGSPRMLDGMVQFARLAGVKLLPGLNLANPDHSILYDMAKAFAAGIPRGLLYGFEIGNEPDFYPKRPLYTQNGTTTYTRPKSYGPSDYAGELRQVLPGVRASTGSRPLAGPSTSLVQDWVDALGRLLPQSGFRLLTLHAYELNGCTKKRSDPQYASLYQLTSDAPYRRLFSAMLPALKAARQAHLPLRVSEANSVACGGRNGLSNATVAGLWMADYLFGLWFAGAQGVNIHASSPLYRPFGSAGRQRASVGASYYGMLAFAEAAGRRARLLPSVIFGARARANLRAWGTFEPGRRIARVLIINKEPWRHGLAVVTVPHAAGVATLKRLASPGLTATSGFRWGGQSYASPTDGAPVGRPVLPRVRRGRGGRFAFTVPRASLTLLTVKVHR